MTFRLVDRIANVGERQIETELQQSEHTQRRGEFHRQSLEASINVRDARDSSSLNYIVLFLTGLQLFDGLKFLFGDDASDNSAWISKLPRLFSLIGFAALIPGAWWLWKRRKLRNGNG